VSKGYTLSAMILLLETLLVGLLGLALGSFLNACASRWPEDEKVTSPRSHCRSCGRTLSWWENVPLVSWLALRGRCRTCKASIGWRYPLVELAVGALWAYSAWQIFTAAPELNSGIFDYGAWMALVGGIANMIFLWLLVALAVLDAENLWLPDRLTVPGIFLGFVLSMTRASLTTFMHLGGGLGLWKHFALPEVISFWFLGAVLPAGGLLVIRWFYQMLRGQEGLGLGDIKLLALIGGWVGMKGAVLTFGIAVGIGVLISMLLYFVPATRNKNTKWSLMKLPFGTFLCAGGIITGLWGAAIIDLYSRLSGM
jgi:leader peptidase (prepilin peptidase) / N-methyltransferase